MNRSRVFHWRSVIDTAIFLVVMAVINHVWFRHVPAFRSYPVHPYLLPIALIGLFYGFREGVASALLANVFYSVQLSAAGFAANSIFHQPDLTNVVVFILGGVFFGEAGELYQRSLHHHRERTAALETSLSSVTEERNRLEVSNRELEEWIRFGDIQLTELHGASEDLFSSEESRILDAAAPLAQKIVGADQCALYLFDRAKERFWRRSQAGQASVENPAAVSQSATPFAQLQAKPAVLSVRDVESLSSGVQFLAAAPIIVQGQLHSVLLIEALPLVRLTPYTLANLGFLAGLLNRCLENAAQRKGSVSEGLEAWAGFRQRIEQEVHAANRYKGAISLLFMDIRNFDSYATDLGPAMAESLVRQVIGVIDRNKRKSDVLSYQGNGRLALLMTQTAPEKTNAFIQRTSEQLSTIAVPAEHPAPLELAFSFGTQTLEDSGLRKEEPPTVPAAR